MRFGVLILYFNAERTILRCIDNCSPFVDRIYISYSPAPWSAYNPGAREIYRNNSNLDIVKLSPTYDKIRIVEGTWDREEDQRNAVVDIAKSEGMDILIIQDPDEFYLRGDYLNNIREIENHPEHPYYTTPWINFWKDIGHVVLERHSLIGRKLSMYSVNPNFAINLRAFPDIHFKDRRLTNYFFDRAYSLSGVCNHLSYVYTDAELKMKIATWGHSHQVQKKWMRYKWLGWTPDSIYVNPAMGPVWHKVVPFKGELPSELEHFPTLQQEFIPLSLLQRVDEWLYNLNQLKNYTIQQLKVILVKRFKLGQYKRSTK